MNNQEFEKHWKEAERYVKRVAWLYSGNREDAEDIMQETRLRAYKKSHQWDGRSFNSWASAIATNIALDKQRANKRRINSCSLDSLTVEGCSYYDAVGQDCPGIREVDENEVYQQRRERLFTALQPFQVETMDLYLAQVPYQDIAEMVKRPVGTVRSRLSRIRFALRKKAMAEGLVGG